MKTIDYFRTVFLIGLAAVLCGTVSAAGMGIVAEPHETSGADAPTCTAPCECMSLTQAMQRWGTDGYEYCSKTVCGQSADAMVQYYCLHQKGSSAAPPAQAQAPAAGAPAAAGATQKSPSGIITILAAIGLVLPVAAGLRRK
ncbi:MULTISPECIES: hypothetical protein [unclassified Methanoregula]|uniref:hypothetical protein n=1 Tax=unclassified Methanoregula TaxID=2649730 RepID=UPI0009C90F4B|nr:MULTISPECIES: hypothetical protein [unclassified Methanoregula]OPX61944.1 MAG: hypothetical protein A4E33_02541 [Methanoregula sp. PtaB.Bin085]OPY34381.1 MAG: hypothetical protein A4E34_01426 [Methanoregula sp. PtaU1.Bin006]